MIENKEEVIIKLTHIIHELQWLQNIECLPDDDSCEVAIQSLLGISDYLQEHLDD